jgi:cystathionine gamma-lyase
MAKQPAPPLKTRAPIPEAQREALGIGAALVRLSIGIEDVDDLRRDPRKALDAI